MIQNFPGRHCLIIRQVYEFLGQLWDTSGSYLSTDMFKYRTSFRKVWETWQDIWIVILREVWFYIAWNVMMHFEKALYRTASPGSAKNSSMNWSAHTFAPWQLEQRQIILPLAVVPPLLKTKPKNSLYRIRSRKTPSDRLREGQSGKRHLQSRKQICCWE